MQLLQYLKSLMDEDPNRDEVNLEDKQLTHLDNLAIDLLGRFSNLRTLNLSENYLTKLPKNLSMLT